MARGVKALSSQNAAERKTVVFHEVDWIPLKSEVTGQFLNKAL